MTAKFNSIFSFKKTLKPVKQVNTYILNLHVYIPSLNQYIGLIV